MSISEAPERPIGRGYGVTWNAAIAGAVVAAALAFVLDSFGIAIGLGLSSASPTWRDTSFSLVAVSGLYLLLTALASYALGGYFAGRMRRPYAATENPEYEDGMHGLLVWGLATLLSSLVAVTTVSFLQRAPGGVAASSQATSTVPG